MANKIQLSPELLKSQAAEMESLKSDYESLFTGVIGDLNTLNSNWSENLSNNFTSKISNAQKTFSGVVELLANGAAAGNQAAETFLSADQALSNINSSIQDAVDKTIGAITGVMSTTVSGTINGLPEKYKDNKEYIDSSSRSTEYAWINKITDYLLKKEFGDFKGVKGILEKAMEGDKNGAFEKFGDMIAKIVGKSDAGVKFFKKYGIKESNIGTYIDYALNVTKDVASAGTEFFMNPSIEKGVKVVWNATVQPVLDTAGKSIEDIVKLIPGISEYYKANGGTDIGSMCSTALGDFYGIITGDDSVKEYAKNYYNDGAFEGVAKGFKDVYEFLRDYGIKDGISSYFDTVAKDASQYLESLGEGLKSLGPGIWEGFSGIFEDYFLGSSETVVNTAGAVGAASAGLVESIGMPDVYTV